MKRSGKKFALFISTLPATPGVYRVFDKVGALIYVGKAKNLRRRLGQYQNAKRTKKHRKMRAIFKDAERIETEDCPSDLEACLLEARLIQQHRPKWNVAGAFSFLYPLVGMRQDEVRTGRFSFCYTTVPEKFPDFHFHGAFRSREITGNAFFAWMRLLNYVGHRSQGPKRNDPSRIKYSYCYSYRQLPGEYWEKWNHFWMGSSRNALEDLSISLLESAAARRDSQEIEEHLRALNRFWRHEAKRLSRVRSNLGETQYPIPQAERDLIFLKNKYRHLAQRERGDALTPGQICLECSHGSIRRS